MRIAIATAQGVPTYLERSLLFPITLVRDIELVVKEKMNEMQIEQNQTAKSPLKFSPLPTS